MQQSTAASRRKRQRLIKTLNLQVMLMQSLALKTLLISRKLTMWNQRRQLISMKRNTVPKISTSLRAVVVNQLEMRANRHLEYLATVLLHASELCPIVATSCTTRR
ncbi:hypothetical protein JG687_00015021 [Phytophthora cactorum]|uniref:Uncharacterized protein n=1 Tax=Phytophthora cactorum TaxID=29920 RepID=A0A8T1TZ55_9STRA|nr:hypothetical protein JG687_00015021 [Phytophthora cactorum]